MDKRGVSEFTGCTRRALDQLVIQYQAAADTFGHCDDDEIAQALRATTEADFR